MLNTLLEDREALNHDVIHELMGEKMGRYGEKMISIGVI